MTLITVTANNNNSHNDNTDNSNNNNHNLTCNDNNCPYMTPIEYKYIKIVI